jgi:hypothetical protein
MVLSSCSSSYPLVEPDERLSSTSTDEVRFFWR